MERRYAAESPGLLAGLVYRLGGEVDPDQPGTGAAGHLEAVSPAAAGEIHQCRAGRQAQRLGDLGDPLPGEQAVRQQAGRQAQVALVDLVLDR